jgi:hypothetical protein
MSIAIGHQKSAISNRQSAIGNGNHCTGCNEPILVSKNLQTYTEPHGRDVVSQGDHDN